MSGVDELARLVGWEGHGVQGLDWSYIEAELGLVLPSDYKALVERFPYGGFNEALQVIQPRSASPAHVEEYLDGVFAWAFDLEDTVPVPNPGAPYSRFRPPYPIFPRVPGIFPWAVIEAENIACSYLSGRPDPDRQAPGYVVRYSVGQFTELTGSVLGCLTDLITGRVVKTRALLSTHKPPSFREWPRPGSRGPRPRVSRDESRPLWPGPVGDRMVYSPRPIDSVDQLLDFGLGTHNAQRVDWPAVEQRLGTPLPGDYKKLIETIGPDWYADVLVASPTGRLGDIPAVSDVMDDLREQLAERYVNPPPVWPDPNGPLAWGRTLGGDFCGWRPRDCPTDPDAWHMLQFNPDGGTYVQRLSMTGYLDEYLRDDERGPEWLIGGPGTARRRWKRWRHKLAPSETDPN